MSEFDTRIRNDFDGYSYPNNPGDVEITKCILGNSSVNRDILPQVKSITITESMFDNYYIEGSISLEDGVGYAELFPIIGDEWIYISFTTPTSGEVNERLYKITSSSPEQYDGNNSLVYYNLRFVTYEYFLNLKEKVFYARNYVSIHSLVQKIYKRYITFFLDSSGNPISLMDVPLNEIYIPEKVKGGYNICISNKTPFNAIHYLSSRSISDFYNGAFYIFYQDKDRFNFTNVEYLMDRPYVLQYTQNPLALGDESSNIRISASYKNIQKYEIRSKFDVIKNLNNGMYASRMLSLDLTRLEVYQRDFYYELPKNRNTNQFFISTNPGSNYRPTVERVAPRQDLFDNDLYQQVYDRNIDLDSQEGFADYLKGIFDNAVKGNRGDWIQESINNPAFRSRFRHLNNNPIHRSDSDVLYSAQSKYFFNNTTERYNSALGRPEINTRGEYPNQVENIFQQRMSQLNQFNNIILYLDVFGHTGRTVGQIVNVVLPTKIPDEYNTMDIRKNTSFSGNYLVTKVIHKLNREPGGARFNHDMSLELRTDSINFIGDDSSPIYTDDEISTVSEGSFSGDVSTEFNVFDTGNGQTEIG